MYSNIFILYGPGTSLYSCCMTVCLFGKWDSDGFSKDLDTKWLNYHSIKCFNWLDDWYFPVKRGSKSCWLHTNLKRSFTLLFSDIGWGANQNNYISVAKWWINLKPCCKFKFVCCLEMYLRKLINLDYEGTLEEPFLERVPSNQPCMLHFRV